MQSTNSFPFQQTIPVIFRDVDAMGHVNHAVYFTYLETTRTRFFYERLNLSSLADLPLILVEASCTYHAPARFGDELTVGLGIGRIGRKSFDIVYRVTDQDSRLIAEARTVMVTFNYESGKSVPIPENLNKLLQSSLIESQSTG